MVINPATPVSTLSEVLEIVGLVLVMTVNPGFGGQKLIPACLHKVRELRDMLDVRNPECLLQVDGGVNRDTLVDVVAAGADTLVMGSAVFGARDGIAAAMREMRAALARLQAPA